MRHISKKQSFAYNIAMDVVEHCTPEMADLVKKSFNYDSFSIVEFKQRLAEQNEAGIFSDIPSDIEIDLTIQ